MNIPGHHAGGTVIFAWIPAHLHVGGSGFWFIQPETDFLACPMQPDDSLTTGLPRDAPETDLARWAQEILGYPVSLEPGDRQVRADFLGARWSTEPVYYATRAA